MSGALVAAVLRDPARAERLRRPQWNALIAAARAEQLIGSVAARLDGIAMPAAAARILADARASAEQGRVVALWEAEAARRVLAPLDVPVVLLKGTAFAAAGLDAGRGRAIGDLDILVPRGYLDRVEDALLAAGWEWVKPDPYDDAYYRRWMHELPPLIHRTRDRMIDVHHTILPPTARPTPDAAALLADAVPLANGLFVLSNADMVVHAAAHLFADGDLQGAAQPVGHRPAGARICRERSRFLPKRDGTRRAARPVRGDGAGIAAGASDLWHAGRGRPFHPTRCSPGGCWPATVGGGYGTRGPSSVSMSVRTGCGCRRRCWRGICGPSGDDPDRADFGRGPEGR